MKRQQFRQITPTPAVSSPQTPDPSAVRNMTSIADIKHQYREFRLRHLGQLELLQSQNFDPHRCIDRLMFRHRSEGIKITKIWSNPIDEPLEGLFFVLIQTALKRNAWTLYTYDNGKEAVIPVVRRGNKYTAGEFHFEPDFCFYLEGANDLSILLTEVQ